MNLWLEPLPDTVQIGDRAYPVRTDFRIWVKCGILLEQQQDPFSLAAELLTLCYPALPPSFEGAVQGILSFYTGGNYIKGDGGKTEKPLYSFAWDGDLIYAAFYSQYGIDLCDASLHWYQFRALFAGLEDSSRFAAVMEAREVNLSELDSPGQKAYYRKLKARYRLPGEADPAKGLEALF